MFSYVKGPIQVGIFAASWITFVSPVLAADLTGSWATDASVCNKVFVKKGDTISFVKDSTNMAVASFWKLTRSCGQMLTCTIKTERKMAI